MPASTTLCTNQLYFFNKNGDLFNFKYSNGIWTGSIYLPEVSVGLFENETIYILQKLSASPAGSPTQDLVYGLPHIPNSTSLNPTWTATMDPAGSSSIQLFHIDNPAEHEPMITLVSSATYNVLNDSSTDITNGYLNINTPNLPHAVKVNICINSADEDVHNNTVTISDENGVIAIISVYGETVGEDERFNVLLSNFGEQILATDEFIFRTSDINEQLPDFKLLNRKRKELFVEYANIIPYLASYKGIINILKFFDYYDIQLKEYWFNPLTNKRTARDIQLDDYKKLSKAPEIPKYPYQKTCQFGLFYDINELTGTYDENGVPITKLADNYSQEEVLIKLFGLKNYIYRRNIGGISRITDIVGQALYFSKYQLNSWHDRVKMVTIDRQIHPTFTIGMQGSLGGAIPSTPLCPPPFVAPITALFNTVNVGATLALSNITPGGVWNTSNISIAAIDSSGLVTGISAGPVVMSYTVINACGSGTTVSYDVEITVPITHPLTITKSAAVLFPVVTDYMVGNTARYTITVTNISLEAFSSITIHDTLSPLLSFISASITPTSMVGGVLMWTMPIAPSSTIIITIDVNLVGSGDALNTGYGISLSPTGTPDIVIGDDVLFTIIPAPLVYTPLLMPYMNLNEPISSPPVLGYYDAKLAPIPSAFYNYYPLASSYPTSPTKVNRLRRSMFGTTVSPLAVNDIGTGVPGSALHYHLNYQIAGEPASPSSDDYLFVYFGDIGGYASNLPIIGDTMGNQSWALPFVLLDPTDNTIIAYLVPDVDISVISTSPTSMTLRFSATPPSSGGAFTINSMTFSGSAISGGTSQRPDPSDPTNPNKWLMDYAAGTYNIKVDALYYDNTYGHFAPMCGINFAFKIS